MFFPDEQEVLKLLWPEEGEPLKGLSSPHKQALIHQAIQKLINHPRVFLGSRAKSPTKINEKELSIYVFKEEGRLVFKLCCGATFIHFSDFHALTKNRVAGQIWIDLHENYCSIYNLSLKKQHIIEKISLFHFPLEALDEIKLRLASINQIIPIFLSENIKGKPSPTNHEPIFRIEFLRSNAMKIDAKVMRCDNVKL